MAYAPFTREEYIDNDYIDSNYCATVTGDKVENFSILHKHVHLAEGVTSYHPTDDIYKEMRFFRRMDHTLRKIDPWCEGGGNDFKGTDDAGDAHYTARLTTFKDGWLIAPHNNDGVDYILNVTGEQISDEGTSGSALMYIGHLDGKILVNYAPPDTEIIKISSSNTDIAAAVWNDTDQYAEGTKGSDLHHLKHVRYYIFIDTELSNIGNGSQQDPFNDISTAIDYAELHGIYDLVISSDITLDRQIKNFTITGIGTPAVNCNSQILTGSEFYHVTLTNTYTGNIKAESCNLSGLLTLNGGFKSCALASNFDIPDGAIALVKDCATLETALIPTEFTVGVASSIIMTSYDGGVQFSDMTDSGSIIKCIRHAGNILLNATCTAGIFRGGGIGSITDNSTMDSVTNKMINPDEVKDIHLAEMGRRVELNLVATIYEDDGVTARKTFDITKDNDGAVTEVNPQ